MRVGSLFSGIGGMDCGLARAGFQHQFLCEIDPWRREILRHHFPGVPVYDDVRAVGLSGELGRPDLLVARFPGVPIYEDVKEVSADQKADAAASTGGGRAVSVGSVPRCNCRSDGRLAAVDARPTQAPYPAPWTDRGTPTQATDGDSGQAIADASTLQEQGVQNHGSADSDGVRARRGVQGLRRAGEGRGSRRAGGSRRPDGTLESSIALPEVSHRKVSQGSVCGRHAPEVDLLVGGFPCTDVSVAGKRAGLAGSRSGLFFEFARIAGELVRPGGYVLVENVPGLFSSNGGRDFHAVLETLADFGFQDLAWRVLDSQFFGVPQRRRRVFILARRAGGNRCAEILLEPEGVLGNHPARDETREGVAETLGGGAGQRGWSLSDTDRMTFVPALTKKMVKGTGGPAGDECQNLVADPITANEGRTYTHEGKNNFRTHNVVFPGVRRLTTTECERLQGLPDGWTGPPGVLKTSDSKRYAGLGDAVTANVAEWICRRLLEKDTPA